ncbi:hypothetical protein ccbrp13_42140 [Ktedonobacteria bacterium brp13]|nr:hypothetical protein ccbrp13_42140 [Ktedonobacteria bacterium brp13]
MLSMSILRQLSYKRGLQDIASDLLSPAASAAVPPPRIPYLPKIRLVLGRLVFGFDLFLVKLADIVIGVVLHISFFHSLHLSQAPCK